jgi:DNA-binding cell septation regulator SpoVG
VKISVKHFPGQYPSFNVSLANDGKEPFIEIKGCKIMNGSNGEFVSWPSRKKDDGSYWNHVYASNDFNAAVLKKAKEGQPEQAPPPRQAPARAAQGSGFDDVDDSDIPF